MYRTVILAIVLSSIVCAIPGVAGAGALVGQWKFDGNLNDSAGTAKGTFVGGQPIYVTGEIGQAISFDGVDDFVNIPSANPSVYTITVWVKPARTDAAGIVTRTDATGPTTDWSHQLRINTGGTFHHYLWVGAERNIAGTTKITPDTWYHVAIVAQNNGPMRLYVNGQEDASSIETAGTLWGSGDRIHVGSNSGHGMGWFKGAVDDLRVYNRELTAAQIHDLANGVEVAFVKAENPSPADGLTGVTSGLLSWSKGDTAASHNIYVGTSPDLTAADPIGARKPTTQFYYAAGLIPGATYYWRVDEVAKDGKTVYTGDVWKFTAAPVTAYGPNPRNGDKWIDPNSDLTWMPGADAQAHDLYFGTDKNLVANRDPSVELGNQLAGPSFELPTLLPGTLYYWLVDEYDSMDAKHEGEVWSFTTASGGGGVKAEYFRNMTVSGAPFLTQIEPSVDHSWGDPGGPTAGVVDNFSARWTADLEIAVADTYTFITTSDDGSRLWLNDTLIVDSWIDQSTTDHFSKALKLDPGIYSLRMEYYENLSGAVAQLSWQAPDVARQIIPPGPLQPPVRAKAIYPKDNDVNVPQDLTLMWSVGEKAVTHDVYFGVDEAAVAAATAADAGLYKGSQAKDENTFVPGALEWGKTYYWRIDEVNSASSESPWKGAVWSFTTADFIVVDDFESYTDEDVGRIFQTWIDGWGYTTPAPGNPGNGTGSTVGYVDPPFAEHSIVHGGGSSMPLGFNNADSPYYSEAERTFDSPQNWTVNGVTTLSLQVRGYPAVTTAAVTETGGKMSLTGSGSDIWNNGDEFTYAYKTLNGDATIVAKVISFSDGTQTWAKGGVMIRDSVDGGSMQASMDLTANTDGAAGNGASFQYRNATNGGSLNTDSTSAIAKPYWVKIERVGDTFNGYLSPDGNSWTILASQDIVMSDPVCIGICVTAHIATEQRTVQFESIKTTGSVTGSWQGAVIASPRYNSAQNLYVALQDSAGKTAVVTDASAVNSATWVEVKMPLSSFTGVSASKIKKIFIGVGSRTSPAADGTGMLYIDDIRVIK